MRKCTQRAGMTLVEIMVVVVVAVVIFGLALGIMVESDRATRRLTQAQAAAQYCNQALGAATMTIESAVAADNIETSNTQALAQTFKADQLDLLTYNAGGLCHARIAQSADSGIVLAHDPIGAVGSAGSQAVQMTGDLGGIKPAGFKPSIRFAYAATTPPGQRPHYQDQWTSPGWPALIQVRVEAKLEDSRTIALETAAIPGLVAARPAREARP